MKKIILLSAVVFLALTSFAQHSAEYYKVTKFMKDRGWTLSADNRTANLKEGGYTTWWNRHYYANLEYAVVAFSDDPDVEDVDVEVRDLDGDLIAKDDDEESWAIARFQLDYAQTLKVKMTNYSSQTPNYASSCRYLIFYK